MNYSGLSKENAEAGGYESPICEVFFVDTRRVICASEPPTEKVTEEEGQW